jgi:hypothetical protein
VTPTEPTGQAPSPADESPADRDRDCPAQDDSSLWRAEAGNALEQVRDELARVEKRSEPPGNAVEITIIEKCLKDALETLRSRPDEAKGWKRVPRWLTLLTLYYSGSNVERTWSSIHRASASLYILYTPDELPAKVSRLQMLAKELPDLDDQTAWLKDVKEKLKAKRVPDLRMRTGLREVYQEATDASSALQVAARTLRNALLLASVVLAVVLLGLGFAHMLDHSLLSVCVVPSDGPDICPAGSSARGLDVFAIELAGMLGGVISVVIPIATGERIKTPYRVFNHQLVLKVLAGAATGFAGVVLIESHFVTGFEMVNGAAIIGYAIFFGASQQALTALIDRQANELAEKTPTTKSV